MLKKFKNKKVLVIIALFLVLVAGGVGALLLTMNKKPVETGEETLVESELYWNADREKYVPKLGGITMRKPEKDGLYTVRFMVKGKLVEYRVKDKDVMIEIDKNSVMGLIIDDDGIITEYVELDRMGVREVAKSCYVQDVDGNMAKVNTSALGDGVEVNLTIKDSAGIWDVTSTDKLGTTTKLQTLDCVRAFNSPEGGITDVFVVTREDELTGVPVERYCEHCKQVVKWRMWIAENSLPTGEGHWRLIRDINMVKQHSMQGIEQIIDLNGKVVTATHKSRLISLHKEGNHLSIMDSSEEKTGTLKGLGDGGFGSIVWIRYDSILDFYSGTIDASENISSGSGTAISVHNKEGVFNMYGGTIIGGTSKAQVVKNEDTGKESFRDGVAGAIAVKGTVNMYGGVIRDGKAVTVKDSKGNEATVAGGNIFLYGGSTFNMYGGTISGGTVPEGLNIGGNIRIAKDAVFNMNGGVIENGACLAQGGNIGLYGTLNMSGGTIRNGKVMTGDTLKKATYNEGSMSHNIFCVNGTLNMTGGLIEGYVRILDNGTKADGTKNECTLKISGTAKIKGGKRNLCLSTGDVVDFGTLKKGAAIYINGAGYVSNETIASNREYVHSDYGVEVLYESKKLLIGKMSCVCGQNHVDENGKIVKEHFGACDGTVEMWMPWTNDSQLPTTAGNWYLISDVKPLRQFTVAKDTTMKLDLNGYRIDGKESTRVYSLRNDNVNMTLTDLSENVTGQIIARGDGSGIGFGNCLWVSGKSKLTMYNGILDASKVECKVDGVAVNVSSNCEFTMYGGEIIGGKAETNGGAVSVSGKFDMRSGIIRDGFAKKDGGNVYIASGGQFNLHGGKILRGEAKGYGGNIGGTIITITGGTVENGVAEAGGNLWSKQSVSISGGEIYHGVATLAGNVMLSMNTSFTMTGGKVTQGVAQAGTGGNLRTIPGCKVVISGGIIEKGIADTDGGNIWMNGGSLKVTGGTIAEGRALEGNGGNICTVKITQGGKTEDTVIELRGGSIESGRAALKGGNMYVLKGDITLGGNPVVKNGIISSTKDASNLYLTDGIIAKLDGLTGEEASIGITCEDTTFAKNANEDKSDVTRFVMDDESPVAQSQDKVLFIGKVGCMCGAHRDDQTSANDGHEDWCTADMREIAWHAWRHSEALPSTAKTGKFYYLTKDVDIIGQYEYKVEGSFGLDLNGHKITQNSDTARTFAIWDTAVDIELNITDTSVNRNGSIGFKKAPQCDYAGRLVWMRNYSSDVEHTVNVYSGTLDAGNLVGTGAPIYVQNGNFCVYGGAVLPKSQTVKDEVTNGINVTKGTLAVNGGTIEGEILLSSGVQLNVGGSPKLGVKVTDNPNGACGLRWSGNLTLTGNNVAATAEITLPDVLNLTVQGTGDERGFKVLQFRNKIEDDSNGDGIGNLKAAAAMCTCGAVGAHTQIGNCAVPESPWQAWDADICKTFYKDTFVILPSTSGSYYLVNDMEYTAHNTTLGANVQVNIDLAGHKVTQKNTSNRVFIMQGGTLNVTDSSEAKTGMITCSGDSSAQGRVLYMRSASASTVNLYDGTLSSTGGSVAGEIIYHTVGTVNMYGGKISQTSNVDGILITNDSVMNVAGGEIAGEVQLGSANAVLNISGSAKVGVSGGTDKEYGIYAPATLATAPSVVCTNVVAVDGGKNIVLKDERLVNLSGTGEETAFDISQNLHNRVSDNNQDGVGTLDFAARMCTCGATGEHTQVGNCVVPTGKWEPWNEAISQEKIAGYVLLPRTSGNYYLTEDMSLNLFADIGNATKKSEAINLDMAGHTATLQAGATNGFAMIRLSQSSSLNIADSVGGGKLVSLYEGTVYGGIIYLWSGNPTVNIYNVALEATKGTTSGYGLVVHRANGIGTFKMYGGSITGREGYTSIMSAGSNPNTGITLKAVNVDGVEVTQ